MGILYNHNVVHQSLLSSSRTFLSPRKEIAYPKQSLPTPAFPESLATIHLSLLMDLPVVDIADKWTHTICDTVCLASFHE